MTNTPHHIRPGMTEDMGVTPDTTGTSRPDPQSDPSQQPEADAPDGPIKDPMAIKVEPSPNPVDPHEDDKT